VFTIVRVCVVDVVQELMASGFVGLFDFFYLPIDLSSGERLWRRVQWCHLAPIQPPPPSLPPAPVPSQA
jgi:hypothetical protein